MDPFQAEFIPVVGFAAIVAIVVLFIARSLGGHRAQCMASVGVTIAALVFAGWASRNGWQSTIEKAFAGPPDRQDVRVWATAFGGALTAIRAAAIALIATLVVVTNAATLFGPHESDERPTTRWRKPLTATFVTGLAAIVGISILYWTEEPAAIGWAPLGVLILPALTVQRPHSTWRDGVIAGAIPVFLAVLPLVCWNQARMGSFRFLENVAPVDQLRFLNESLLIVREYVIVLLAVAGVAALASVAVLVGRQNHTRERMIVGGCFASVLVAMGVAVALLAGGPQVSHFEYAIDRGCVISLAECRDGDGDACEEVGDCAAGETARQDLPCARYAYSRGCALGHDYSCGALEYGFLRGVEVGDESCLDDREPAPFP